MPYPATRPVAPFMSRGANMQHLQCVLLSRRANSVAIVFSANAVSYKSDLKGALQLYRVSCKRNPTRA